MRDKIVSKNLKKDFSPPVREFNIERVTRYVVNHQYVRNCPQSCANNRVPVSLARVRFLEGPK
jgi:hypothetical protein